jgi:hypothetical protein
MTPKEKAKELFERFRSEIISFLSDNMKDENAKRCALIAVDEILKIIPQNEYMEDRGEFNENRELIYWKEVKQEIENL